MAKYNDAMMSAKTALKLRPNSSRCFAILGRVISKSNTPNGRKEVMGNGYTTVCLVDVDLTEYVCGWLQAVKAYDKAIRLNPKNVAAVQELSDLYFSQNMFEEAANW